VGQQVGLDPLLILAVMAIESRFNPIAESVMGAKGLMQVIPKLHRDKLEAFLGRYCAGLAPAAADALCTFWRRWNDGEAAGCATAWPALRAALPELAEHAVVWARDLADSGEMAAQLVEFAGNRVE